ncbi:MAG TPA: TRAP transporter small permease [Casimicrobiaceae bacterium]|nr:TRAP transporter small permease [Casimicrobiaceae bacterium]
MSTPTVPIGTVRAPDTRTVSAGAPADEHVLDESGHFHVTDAPIDLGQYTAEAWIAFAFFWLLALNVFYQFFTRYVLNDSASWTEEIARYLLICMVFVGVSAAVRTSRHIHVDFLYRLIPRPAGRVLATLVDVVKIVFFAFATVLTWQMMEKMVNYKMTIIDLPMNLVYGVCMFGFACATLRSIQVAIMNWRRGYGLLERPDAADEIAR